MKTIVTLFLEKVERVRVVFPYLLAVFVSAAAIAVSLFLKKEDVFVDPFLLLLPSIIASAWYGGFVSAMFTTVISSIAFVYFFNPFYLSFTLAKMSDLGEVLLFAFIGIFIGYVVEYYKKTDRENVFREKERTDKKEINELKTETVQMKKQIKARDEFLSIASHELKTPLTSMLLRLQSALHNIRNVSLANFSVTNLMSMLVDIEDQSKRLSRMINDLLNVSLITTGRLDLEKEKVDLSELTKSVVGRFSEKLEKVGYVLKADKPIIGTFDKLRLEQVITNLISNAIKYGQGKPIEITVKKSNGKGIITVKDQGIGISKKDKKRVFGRFERAVSNNYKGLGVGLYISSKIIEFHKGVIKVQSKEGKGSTFTIKLPIKKS